MVSKIMTRRGFNAALAATAIVPMLPRSAAAAGNVVAAVFPNAWEDAYRRIIGPMLAEKGIELTLAPTLAQDQLAKMMASAGNPPFDTLLMSPGQTAVAAENGLIEKIDPSRLSNWDQLDDAFKSEWGPIVTVEVNGIAYNPDVVPRPKGYRDLFENPAYDKKVAWIGFGSNTATMAYVQLASIFGKGPDDMDAVFKLFKDYLPKVGAIAESGSQQMTLYQQGEIAVFMASTNNVATLKARGVPCEFVHPETGSPSVPVAIHLTKGAANADNAYAYMDATISKAAQDKLKLPPTEQIPTNKNVELTPGIEAYVTKVQLKTFVYLDWVAINKHRAEWTKAFDRVIKI